MKQFKNQEYLAKRMHVYDYKWQLRGNDNVQHL